MSEIEQLRRELSIEIDKNIKLQKEFYDLLAIRSTLVTPKEELVAKIISKLIADTIISRKIVVKLFWETKRRRREYGRKSKEARISYTDFWNAYSILKLGK